MIKVNSILYKKQNQQYTTLQYSISDNICVSTETLY